MGRPCSINISASSGPFSIGAAISARSSIKRLPGTSRSPMRRRLPRKKYSIRFVPGDAAGSVNRAPGSIFMVQIATSLSGLEAHDFGGGEGALASPSRPATTISSVAFPAASRSTILGIVWLQNIAKCGSANLSARGRFNQI